MKTQDAVAALAALAQDNRLDVFRLLVQAGPDGMAAGRVAEELDLAPNTLTFHFDRLRLAGLVTVRREGRSMIYAARFETMNGLLAFLTENCCQDRRHRARQRQSANQKESSMKRLHVHVAVNDLQHSIGFYSALFAAEPSITRKITPSGCLMTLG